MTGVRRAIFLVSTIGLVAALVLLLSHRSENPVAFGRYSASLLFLVVAISSAYVAIAYACWRGLERFGQAYTTLATNLLGFVLLVIAVNVGAVLAAFFLRPAAVSGNTSGGAAAQEQVHAELIGLDADGYYQFRAEQGRPKNYQYEPWVGFRETPRDGRFINVSSEGFRKTAGTPSEPEYWIYLLGGSTTFGYGVSDEQTIASHLQAKVSELYGERTFGVRNFGRAWYYSAQEFVLLWTLLADGAKPSIVIFIDGMNEGQTRPYYVSEMRVMFDRYQDEQTGTTDVGAMLKGLALQTPIYPYVRGLYQPAPAEVSPMERPMPTVTAAEIASQYEATNEAIKQLTARHGVEPFFVVQPMPGYRNSHGIHTFRTAPPHPVTIDILARMAAETEKHPERVNLTGLLESYHKQAFVDPLHYSPDVHRMIAHAIADHVGGRLADLARR